MPRVGKKSSSSSLWSHTPKESLETKLKFNNNRRTPLLLPLIQPIDGFEEGGKGREGGGKGAGGEEKGKG